ncbi:DNA-repair protein XRCC1 isoform X1 [Ananas comosus]|uniref:DNA-repair protein XRCC1 isoform X1 n=2 Tax=Ananas comosus TaxID=4615 RepID=A0A6P5FVU5_ANACO|nr:DNA-repair protein XRCC1 isoform X1 [Ananas comosus]
MRVTASVLASRKVDDDESRSLCLSLSESDMPQKRSLPSWMSSKESANKSGEKKKQADSSGGSKKQAKGNGDSSSHQTTRSISDFSKLLDGVVFALSGFVNPERSTLRSQALEMGAEYRPDWTSDCTLLICAFSNTPKFRQVESDNGTVVSKEWILECYKQRKLVEIEPYLMHAGKPWRKINELFETKRDQKSAPPKELQEKSERSHVKTINSAASEVRCSDKAKDYFSPSKIKKWALDDLNQTVSWLESQDEKPEQSELKAIAAEGIFTCLQDAIEALEQNHSILQATEQWKFVPRVVQELAELESKRKKGLSAKKELAELATKCKEIYEIEFNHSNFSPKNTKEQKGDSNKEEYDSDETIEMTEEEIELACKNLSKC